MKIKIIKNLASVYRHFLMPLFQKQKRIQKTLSFTKTYGGEPISKSQAIKQKKTDIIYILGCGASINRLDKEQIEDINRNDSIGVNRWAYHEIIPTYYSLEIEKDANSESNINLVSNINQKWNEYKKTMFIVKQREVLQKEVSDLLAKIASNGMLYWNNYNIIPGADQWTFSLFLRAYHRLGLLENNNFFANKAASIIWCLGFAYKLGYKKIILSGVDLYGNYFWLKQDKSSKTGQSNLELHKTADPKRVCGYLTAIDIIGTWNNTVLKPKGVQLFISHQSSLLSEHLPVYRV